MDYIPRPLFSFSPPGTLQAVPLLTEVEYDATIEFEHYPERQNWGKKSLSQWYAIFNNPSTEFQAFLQRWLLFAPLQAFVGRGFNFSNFQHFNPDTQSYELRLSILPRIAKQWLRSPFSDALWRLGSLAKTLPKAQAVHQVLSTPDVEDPAIYKVIVENPQYTLEEFIGFPGRKDPCHPAISIAISALHIFIESVGESVAKKLFRGLKHESSQIGHSKVFQWRSPIWNVLLQQGWCPSELVPMSVRFNTAGLVFISQIERPFPYRRHEIGNDYERLGVPSCEDTQNCTSFSCFHRRLEDAKYSTAHIKGCEGCSTIIARREDMTRILNNDSYPLVVSASGNTKATNIELVPWTPGTYYIAISHVWSDGLGNVHENGLPICQFHRISEYVRKLADKPAQQVLFWLDTICVPPDESKEDDLQNLAIAKMRDTYANSSITLVLDAWLLSTSTTGMTDVEKMMRIFSSVWNSRLWTYQEGALPKSIWFQFKDAAQDLEVMKERVDKVMEQDLSTRFTLGPRLIYQYNSLRGFRTFDPQSEDFILFVMGNMLLRSTSVATDEALCLSTLMGLDMRAFLNVKPQDRMAEFWRRVPCVPSSLLLASVPTLDDTNLSWAPRSILLGKDRLSRVGSVNTISNVSLSIPASLTPSGLRLRTPGLIIKCNGFRPRDDFEVQDNLKFTYLVRPFLCKGLDLEAFQKDIAILVVNGADSADAK
ncbi:hypothetical protein FOBRF1_004442 [Fusarium oxysporum]